MTTAIEREKPALAAITGNGWVAGGLGTGQSMTALGATIRPADALGTAGLGWLAEPVGPLQETVDRMAGNASVIQTFADAWQRLADDLDRTGEDLTCAARADTAGWQGSAADGYRGRAAQLGSSVHGTAVLAAGLASAARTMGEVLADARQNAGDLLADLVRRLISYAAQAVAAEGGVTATVVAQATDMINSSAGPIAALEQSVRQTITNVAPLLRALADEPADTTSATTTRSPWQVASLEDTPMVLPRPDTPPVPDPLSTAPLRLLSPGDATSRLPDYYRSNHSDYYDTQLPFVQRGMRTDVESRTWKQDRETWMGLSDPNTEAALRLGPPGTYPWMTGEAGRPAIRFREDDPDGPVLLNREVVDMDPTSNGTELRAALDVLGRVNAPVPSDVFVQVPDGTTTDQLNDFLRRVGPVRAPGTTVFFRDTTNGQLLGVGIQENTQ